jgi:uncharacterized integral membrane protein
VAKNAFGDKNERSLHITARGVIAVVVISLLVIVALQNFQSVRIDLLFWGGELPLWLIIGGAAFLGALLDDPFRNLYRYLRGKND